MLRGLGIFSKLSIDSTVPFTTDLAKRMGDERYFSNGYFLDR